MIHATLVQDFLKTLELALHPQVNAVQFDTPRTLNSTLHDSLCQLIRQEIEAALQPLVTSMINLSATINTLPSSLMVSEGIEQVSQQVDDVCSNTFDIKGVLSSIHESMVTTPTTNDLEAPAKSSIPQLSTPPCKRQEVHPSILQKNQFIPLSSDEEDSDADDGLECIVNVKMADGVNPIKKQKKVAIRTPNRSSPLESELVDDLSKLTEYELLDKLREREAARRESTRAPEHLTEEEKALSMDALFRKWKLERQRAMNEREQLRFTDFEALGELTEEQKLMNRSEIRRLINHRKNQVWAKAMRTRGIDVIECNVCHRLHTGQHQCLRTSWTTDNTRNSPITKSIIVTQSPQGVHLRSTAVIDEEKVYEEYKRLKTQVERLEANKRLATPNTPTTIPDTPMREAADSHCVTIDPKSCF
jgi:hypothetical protein